MIILCSNKTRNNAHDNRKRKAEKHGPNQTIMDNNRIANLIIHWSTTTTTKFQTAMETTTTATTTSRTTNSTTATTLTQPQTHESMPLRHIPPKSTKPASTCTDP
jgi:hypothetical protein